MASRHVEERMKNLCAVLVRQHLLEPRFEYMLPNGRRLDVAALGKSGKLLGIEIKTSIYDMVRDLKWAECARYCRLFYFAVPVGLDIEKIPPGPGVITCSESQAVLLRRNRWRAPQNPKNLWHDQGRLLPKRRWGT